MSVTGTGILTIMAALALIGGIAMVSRIEVTDVAFADPFQPVRIKGVDVSGGPATTPSIPASMFLLIRAQVAGPQPVFTCPSGTAEKDLMNPSATTRSNFIGGTSTATNVDYTFVTVHPVATADGRADVFKTDFAVATSMPTTAPSGFTERMFNSVRTFIDSCANGACTVDVTSTGGLKR